MPDNEDKLASLHGVVLDGLLARLKSSEAKPADFAAAIKFLKDNNITSTPAGSKGKLQELLAELPDFGVVIDE